MNKQFASTRFSHTFSSGHVFRKNLRLLDLDEEFDWPHITSNTFAANDSIRNLSKRTFAAAWIFYKLLEILEPVETKAVRWPFTLN